mmetsp:Transcript_29203/g.64233  ORF Transcript_29203/g.64233 Transcript_29203/m.64233 type:complete len:204 (+) Transcript_29203:250-861(+)
MFGSLCSWSRVASWSVISGQQHPESALSSTFAPRFMRRSTLRRLSERSFMCPSKSILCMTSTCPCFSMRSWTMREGMGFQEKKVSKPGFFLWRFLSSIAEAFPASSGERMFSKADRVFTRYLSANSQARAQFTSRACSISMESMSVSSVPMGFSIMSASFSRPRMAQRPMLGIRMFSTKPMSGSQLKGYRTAKTMSRTRQCWK